MIVLRLASMIGFHLEYSVELRDNESSYDFLLLST